MRRNSTQLFDQLIERGIGHHGHTGPVGGIGATNLSPKRRNGHNR
jgi:hypothetical protein